MERIESQRPNNNSPKIMHPKKNRNNVTAVTGKIISPHILFIFTLAPVIPHASWSVHLQGRIACMK